MSEKNNSYPTHEQVAELNDSVESLKQEVQVLRNVLDEIRENLSWSLRNQQLEQTEEKFESGDNKTDEETKEIEEEEGEEIVQETSEDSSEVSTDEIVEELDNAEVEHAEWIRTIRDPAYANSEGIRRLEQISLTSVMHLISLLKVANSLRSWAKEHSSEPTARQQIFATGLMILMANQKNSLKMPSIMQKHSERQVCVLGL